MSTTLRDLKQALSLLGPIDKEMERLALNSQTSTPELVNIGQQLWWIVKRATRALEPIKDRLRQEADGVTQKFDSGEGTHCMVVCPVPKVVLRKEADIPRLKAALGDRFSDLFEEVVQVRPRKDIQELVKDCSQKEMQAVLAAVDMMSDTPRVAFKD
jgi:hypothetical protein